MESHQRQVQPPRVRKWVVVVSAGIAVIIELAQLLVLAELFVAPRAHDVHSPGGIPIRVQTAASRGPVLVIAASESIADLRCQVWLAGEVTDQGFRPHAGPCPDAATLAAAYWPQFSQSPKTLYLTWRRCFVFNVEYITSRRALIIHCYTAGTFIPSTSQHPGTAAESTRDILVAPTDVMSPGSLNIVEDDRVERFIGDYTTERQLATATIS
jgi:hypothetical protein